MMMPHLPFIYKSLNNLLAPETDYIVKKNNVLTATTGQTIHSSFCHATVSLMLVSNTVVCTATFPVDSYYIRHISFYTVYIQ